MGRQVIHATATTSAAPAAVYALLEDGSTWPEWSGLDTFELLEPGESGGDGLGALRRFTRGRNETIERVVVAEPGRQLSYELLEGLPIKAYRADVTIEAREDGGSDLAWHSEFEAKVPGTGGLIRRGLGKFIQETVDGLAGRAGQTGAG